MVLLIPQRKSFLEVVLTGILTGRLKEPAKALAGIEQDTRPGMFLVVVGTADKAEIRFEGNRDFLSLALEAVEQLVDDILEAEENQREGP